MGPLENYSERDTRRRLSKIALNMNRRRSSERQRNKIPLIQKYFSDTLAPLLAQPPLFYSEDHSAPQIITLDPEIKEILPQSFYKNPTLWIEAQPNIDRGPNNPLPTGNSIQELIELPYDVSKVKIVRLEGKQFVIKRIVPTKQNEISRAQKAYSAGIPTPKILGVIEDQGNVYAVFEHIAGKNLAFIQELNFSVQYTVPALVSDKQTFDIIVCEHEFWKKIDIKTRTQLVNLWRRNKSFIAAEQLTQILLPGFKNYNSPEEMVVEKKSFLTSAPVKTLQQVLSLHGFGSLEEYCASFFETNTETGTLCQKMISGFHLASDKRLPTTEADFKIQEMIDCAKIPVQFSEKWIKIIETALFGFPITSEKIRIMQLCESTGLVNKDFGYQNWVLSDTLPPRLYLIDWEEYEATPVF